MPTVGGYSYCYDDYGDDSEVIVLFPAIIMTPMVMFVVIVVMITVVALTIIAIVVVILVHIVLMAIMFVVTAWCDRILRPGFGRILFRVRKSCHKVGFRRHAEQIRPSSWPARRASTCHYRIFISQGCETNPAEFLAGSAGATFQAGKLSQH